MIDTFELATGGQLNTNTFTLASNGVLVQVKITDETVIIPDDRFGGGSGFGPSRSKRRKYKRKPQFERHSVKRVEATVTIDGIKYTDVKYIKTDIDITANNVVITIDKEQDKPKVNISFK